MKIFDKVKRPTMEETITALYVTIMRDVLTMIDARLAGRQVEINDYGGLIITTTPPDWTPESEQNKVKKLSQEEIEARLERARRRDSK
jgi:hypothetical protein